MRAAIRDVPDFPKPGILFKDITPLLGDANLFQEATDALSAPFLSRGITHVVAIESRGFILGGPVAQRLGAGLVPVRKAGKLPRNTERVSYGLEYGTDVLEIHSDAFAPTSRVLVVDDVLATGGTAHSCVELVRRLGGEVAGASFLIALGFLPGLQRLEGTAVHALITY